MKQTVRVLLLGDVVGNIGRMMFQKHITQLKSQHAIDMVIVNGENSNNDGRGITSRIVHFFKHNGADVITTGNHVYNQKEIYECLRERTDILRPANFSSQCPGKGHTIVTIAGVSIAVINIQGRIFMREHVDCPFATLDSLLTYIKTKTSIILVDVHAEATAEKLAIAYHLQGRVSAVVGTHTHVPTADERILPGGTAYVTDLGMAGSLNSMIGMTKESVMPTFLTQMPSKFHVDGRPPIVMTGVIVEIDTNSGKALSIERIKIIDEDLSDIS